MIARHRRATRVLAALGVLILLAAVGLYASIPLLIGSAPAPFNLPAASSAPGSVTAPSGGTWVAGSGSQAGYRVRVSILGQGGDIVGRTGAVSGNVVLAGARVVSATVAVDLRGIEQDGKPQRQLAKIMDLASDPDATFTLTSPIELGPDLTAGTPFTVTAAGTLAMNGTSRPVTVTLLARFDGVDAEIVSSVPVTFSDWGIKMPEGLEDHGAIEFLLVLQPSAS
jgi:polyisoprenoid-binding protein YceI